MEDYPLVCLDESMKQLVAHTQLPFRNAKGIQHYDFHYQRAGVASLFMLFAPFIGKRFVLVRDSHTHQQWAKVISFIVLDLFPKAKRITIVQDNYKTHNPAYVYRVFRPELARALLDKLEFIYTPVHGSWLNMAEIELSALARQCLNQRIPNQDKLKELIAAWQKQRNLKSVKIDWRFSLKNARIKLKKLYPTIIN